MENNLKVGDLVVSPTFTKDKLDDKQSEPIMWVMGVVGERAQCKYFSAQKGEFMVDEFHISFLRRYDE